MKKTIFLILLIQLAIALPAISADDKPLIAKTKKPAAIQSIVVNADVTIVLLNYENGPIEMVGDDDFKDQVVLKQTGNKLVISSVKNAKLLKKGIVYIPARSVEQIQVNSAAFVKSAGALEISRLDIRINGECKIHIVHLGELNLIGNDYYSYTQETKEVRFPSRMLKSAKE